MPNFSSSICYVSIEEFFEVLEKKPISCCAAIYFTTDGWESQLEFEKLSVGRTPPRLCVANSLIEDPGTLSVQNLEKALEFFSTLEQESLCE